MEQYVLLKTALSKTTYPIDIEQRLSRVSDFYFIYLFIFFKIYACFEKKGSCQFLAKKCAQYW